MIMQQLTLPEYKLLIYDWKEKPSILYSILEYYPYFSPLPRYIGTDTFGFIVSTELLTKEQIAEINKDFIEKTNVSGFVREKHSLEIEWKNSL